MKRVLPLTVGVLCLGFLVGSFITRIARSRAITSQPNYTIRFARQVLNTKTGYLKDDPFIEAKRAGSMFAKVSYRATGGTGEVKPYASELWFSAENKYVWLHHQAALMSTQYYPQGRRLRTFNIPDPTCETRKLFTVIGRDTFLGIPVVKLKADVKTPTGTRVVRVVWDAPDCDCESLYSRTDNIEPDGSISVVDLTMATDISFATPDPGLFAIPMSYQEGPPSAIAAYSWATSGIPKQQNLLDGRDRRYYRSQAYKPK